jgi:hypothetical protein
MREEARTVKEQAVFSPLSSVFAFHSTGALSGGQVDGVG